MTTPAGTIAMSDINDELGFSSAASLSLNDSAVRGLAGVPSGAISLYDLRSKTMRWYPGSSNGPSVSRGPGGTMGESTIYYDSFGSVTVSGTLYVVISGSCSDSADTAVSSITLYVNGSQVGQVNSDLTGTPQTFDFPSGSPFTVYLPSCDLSSLSVVIGATGGAITHLVDYCAASADVSDIYFAR